MKYIIGFIVGILILIAGATLYDYATCQGIYLIDCRPAVERGDGG